MRIILSSNVSHYSHLAEALETIGWLDMYLTSVAPIGTQALPKTIPAALRNRLEGRRIRAIPPSRVHRLVLPEVLQKLLPSTKLVSHERADWIHNHAYDVLARSRLHACDAFHFSAGIGLLSARRARSFGARVTCDVRQEHPAYITRLLSEEHERLGIPDLQPGRLYQERIVSEIAISDHVIVPSAYARFTFTSQGYPASRISILPYGVDTVTFSEPTQRLRDTFRILFVGRLTYRKGVHYLLDAVSRLTPQKADLLLIGSVDPAFKPIISRYPSVFRHLASSTKTGLAGHYRASSVLVLPSVSDSFGLVALEAMACGLPVIVSEHTGAADVVRDGVEGFVVPSGDMDCLRDRLSFLRDHPSVCEAMGEAARFRALGFSWDSYRDAAVRLVRRLYANHVGVGMGQ